MNTTTQPKIKGMSPQLQVSNLEHSIEFYTKKLGFELEFRYEDFYAGVIKDGWSVHLKCGETSLGERKTKREQQNLDIVFAVTEVGVLYEEMQNKAVEITQPLCERPYGTEFYIADPDGNILAFLE